MRNETCTVTPVLHAKKKKKKKSRAILGSVCKGTKKRLEGYTISFNNSTFGSGNGKGGTQKVLPIGKCTSIYYFLVKKSSWMHPSYHSSG